MQWECKEEKQFMQEIKIKFPLNSGFHFLFSEY